MQRSAFCRSRRELSNAYLLAKFGFDTAEHEPSKVCRWREAEAAAQQTAASCERGPLGGEAEIKGMGGPALAFDEPSGEFMYKGRVIRKISLLGGGTGIAPMIQVD